MNWVESDLYNLLGAILTLIAAGGITIMLIRRVPPLDHPTILFRVGAAAFIVAYCGSTMANIMQVFYVGPVYFDRLWAVKDAAACLLVVAVLARNWSQRAP